MFQNAHDVLIQGGNFYEHSFHHEPTGIDILLAATAQDAAVDAKARRYAPACHPGTREQYIEDLTEWATTLPTDKSPSIYWIRGPAGVGKSALAQTCAERVKAAGQLGAAFFFSISGCDDPDRLFATLAYQLSTVFPDYRQILNDRVKSDRTLLQKKLPSQFEALIVEPLRELETQGKGLQRRAIFIDGLDECSSEDAQGEIVQIIGASVKTQSTPFCWAVFSRPVPGIAESFDDEHISPLSRRVELLISRDSDREIELYIRATFENILRRRDLLHLSPTWPPEESLKQLVIASGGLFAYPAAVLRFIDDYSYSDFKESLQAVLHAIHRPNIKQPLSPFATLDAFYILFMNRIPVNVLPAVRLLLSCLVTDGFGQTSVATRCNILGFSQTDFRKIMNVLHPVMVFQEGPKPLVFDHYGIDMMHSYFDQRRPFQSRASIRTQLRSAHGSLRFHHKSFYDFLKDPARSSNDYFITTPAMCVEIVDCLVQRHHHYARSYAVQGITRLVLAAGASSFSTSIFWPHGSEFVDSFLMLNAFRGISRWLSHDHPSFHLLLRKLPSNSLQKLAELDYHKALISEIMLLDGVEAFISVKIIGLREAGVARYIAGTLFKRIQPQHYRAFDPEAFLKVVKKMEDLGIIKSYHRPLATVTPTYLISRLKISDKISGQYRLGHGEKSVIWYWEFDPQKRYFHEFQTLDIVEARRIYDTEKFKMWDKSWIPPS